MAEQNNDASKDHKLVVRSYIAPKQQTPETLSKVHELTHQHPSEREYLSTRDYNKAFAADQAEVNHFIQFAEEKSWEVNYDKKTREVTITIPNPDDFEGSHMHCVRNTSPSGDVDLEANKAPDEIKEGTHKKGFVKNNTETRTNKREAAPLQSADHGQSILEIAEAYNFPDGDGAMSFS